MNVNLFTKMKMFLSLEKQNKKTLKELRVYPKGSNLKFITDCIDCDTAEKELIRIFKIKFAQRKTIGREYFEGDPKQMKSEIMKYLRFVKINNQKKPLVKLTLMIKLAANNFLYCVINKTNNQNNVILFHNLFIPSLYALTSCKSI